MTAVVTAVDTITQDDVETRPEVIYREPGDDEKFSHYVDKRVWDVTAAMVDGTAVQAQCGKWWVPTRDATKFPVCPDCQAIVDHRSRD